MMNDRKIKVLVVEDSTVVRTMLVHILSADPQIQVIGTANNGREALEFLTRQPPDVILMDIDMPEMNGFEATRRIMESRPLPIVICSGSSDPRETNTTFRLMEVGALACVEKPLGKEHKDFERVAAYLRQTVKLMSEVKVVRRWPRSETAIPNVAPATTKRHAPTKIQFIGIGASTGGPPVLQTILGGLTKDFPVPILIVQHITPGFLDSLANWLNRVTELKIHVASHGTHPLPGNVYLAPDDFHMTVGSDKSIVLSKDDPEAGLRPSVACLFRSLASACGPNAVGVLLTGMGRDGAQELKLMHNLGAMTIAQDRETSVIHGMPGEAIAIGAATYVLPSDKIASALVTQVNHHLLVEGGRP
jgi:two-component system chemotaxis response regulator CheB